jgi:hypothetical protein
MKKIKQFLEWNNDQLFCFKDIDQNISKQLKINNFTGIPFLIFYTLFLMFVNIFLILLIIPLIISSLLDIIYYFVKIYDKYQLKILVKKQELIRFNKIKNIIESKNEEYNKLEGMLQIVKCMPNNIKKIIQRDDSEEFNIKTKTLNLFVNYLMNINCYTIIKGDPIDRKQCHNYARRSILDVWSIIKNYYPESNFDEFLKSIIELIKEEKLYVSKCGDIGKYVLYTSKMSTFNGFEKPLEIYGNENNISFEDLITYYKYKK